MGNRANVVFYTEAKRLDGTTQLDTSPAIYLHWNGGPESVFNFLKEMDRRQIRKGDTAYEAARFCQIIGDLFDDEERKSLSVGLLPGPTKVVHDDDGEPKVVSSIDGVDLMPLDHGDNGIYLIDRKAGTFYRTGGYSSSQLMEGTLEEAYASVEANPYTGEFADTFLSIDKRLYKRQRNLMRLWNWRAQQDELREPEFEEVTQAGIDNGEWVSDLEPAS